MQGNLAEADDQAAAYCDLRRRMVERQIRGRGVLDRRVLAAMSTVPRHEFVPALLRAEAYADWPLPIGFGQTISQPFTVAFMAEALMLRGGEKVLEIGTGSGYAAAVLAQLAGVVHSVERIPELGGQARATLQRLGYENVHVHLADGTFGLPGEAPFDAIVVTAGAEQVPQPLPQQLSDGGRLVIPIGEPAAQYLMRFTKQAEELRRENLGGFAFVPLIGRHG